MSRKTGTITEETKSRLIQSAAAEFSEHGYQKSSLRRICSNAQVTTGALYFFFQDKDDLFRQIISPITNQVLSLMASHYDRELSASLPEILNDSSEDFQIAEELMEFYFRNSIICDILLNHRDHPAVCAFFDELTDMMDKQTEQLLRRSNLDLRFNAAFNSFTIHWFSHLQIDSFVTILSHHFDESRAKEQLKIQVSFLRGGFRHLLYSCGDTN